MKNIKRRHGYKFTEKTHSKRGMLATFLAFLLLLWYFIFVEISFRQNGALSTYYGSAGVLAMMLSVVVLVFAFGSLKEEDSFVLFQRAGIIFSFLAVFCWIGTYALGIIF
jgi:uncharacterized membrane protein (DUF485 family)